jgi:adenosylmethionine-8-amino-7-oxononanoate aminotransferase
MTNMEKGVDSIYEYVVHRGRGERPVIERGEGIYLFDREGKRYLDGASGSVVANLGHGAQGIARAMCEQAQHVGFAAPHLFAHQSSLDLGQAISARAPGELRENCRIWFNCTGTDAVDDALRLARQYFISIGKSSKHLVIARWQSFHGNSIGMAGVHGHTRRRRAYSPMFINAPHIPAAYCYRCAFGLTYPECNLRCARALETEIRQQGPENVAAFIAEPVVGAALGAVPAPAGYFEVVRQICDEYEVLFIDDEVMSCWGRTGHWFAIEGWGVTPDIIAAGKGLGAGYTPIAATLARREMWETIETNGRSFLAGHTMNQNPVSCATALAVTEQIEEMDLLDHAQQMGDYLRSRLEELLEFEIVGDVRGMGLLCGFEFVRDKASKAPFDPALGVSALYQRQALSRGLMQYACTGCVEGAAGDMNIVAPPLVITTEQVDEMIALIKEALTATQEALKSSQ